MNEQERVAVIEQWRLKLDIVERKLEQLQEEREGLLRRRELAIGALEALGALVTETDVKA